MTWDFILGRGEYPNMLMIQGRAIFWGYFLYELQNYGYRYQAIMVRFQRSFVELRGLGVLIICGTMA